MLAMVAPAGMLVPDTACPTSSPAVEATVTVVPATVADDSTSPPSSREPGPVFVREEPAPLMAPLTYETFWRLLTSIERLVPAPRSTGPLSTTPLPPLADPFAPEREPK